MPGASCCLLYVLIIAAPATSGDGGGTRLAWSAAANLGVEYDSNATRLDADASAGSDPVHAALLRGQAHGALRWRPLGSLMLAAGYDLAGKVFFMEEARHQDALIHRATLGLGLRLADRLLARLAGVYHEGFQRETGSDLAIASLFDFRLMEGRAQLTLVAAPAWNVSAGAGFRRFTYKPDSRLSFDAFLGFLALSSSRVLGKGAEESELDFELSYTLSERRYADQMEVLCTSEACIEQCEADPDCSPGDPITFGHPSFARRDLVHRLHGEATWVGPVLVSASYILGISRSSSYGLSYIRHDVTAKTVAALPWKIYGTLQLRLRLLSSQRPLAVEVQALGFDEENRSHALLQIERPIWNRLRAVVRYTLFVGDIRSPEVTDLRHLVYAGLAYRYRDR